MKHIDLVVPFALPKPEMAVDLLREMTLPALAMLISRAKKTSFTAFDNFSRALPHEIWLAHQSGLESHVISNGSLPVAIAAMWEHALRPASGIWFILQPVHIHIARDHLVLTDFRQLTLSEQESRALFDTAHPLFDEASHELLYGDAQTWFVRADAWYPLQTATPDAACGHNIDIWMPKGTGERAWRKLQNEVHMHWHTHPVNMAREQRGERPINSLWLWGGAPATVLPTSPPNLRIVDNLIKATLAEDWSDWLTRMRTLESNWFMPLLQSLKNGEIQQIRLILTHNTGLSEFTVTRNSLRKFWIKPTLTPLTP